MLCQHEADTEKNAAIKQHPTLRGAMKKAACNVCHVKGEPKTEENSYGIALNKLIMGSANKRLDTAKAVSKEELGTELEN